MSRLTRPSGSGKKVFVLFLVLLILLVVGGFFGIAVATTKSNKILKGVTVSNLSYDIQNKTVEEAKKGLPEFQEDLGNKALVVEYNGSRGNFSGKDVNITVLDSFIDDAYQIGRDGSFFANAVIAIKSLFGAQVGSVEAQFTLDQALLNNRIESLVDASGTTAVNGSYEIFDDSIKVTKGHDGIRPKYDKVKSDLLASAGILDDATSITIEADVDKSVDVDIEALYNQVYVEKANAEYTDGGKYVAEKVGKSFNKNNAYAEYRNLNPDGEMTIPLILDEPEITTENLDKVLFADILGTFKTTYNASNTNRSSNLALAANSINNKIYIPGAEFSYNQELGERTAARGYKEAHVYSGGEVVDGLGGGICQISSTLYNAVLLADLDVTLRKNHMFWPEYVKPSFDATVAWNSIDFKFKNNRETPIKIVASAKGGVATVTIYGKKKENEPTIELVAKVIKEIQPTTITRNDDTLEVGKQVVSQSPVVGYVSEGYKVYKDSTGKEIKRELISSDTYKATDKIIKVGTKKIEPTPIPTKIVDLFPTTTPTEAPASQEPTPTPTSSSEWPTGWDTPENPNFR